MKNKKCNGFTLVEMVIVIAVIAILSAVLIPNFANVIEAARESARHQQAVNAQKELISPDGYLPEDTIGITFGIDNHYYEIIENFTLIKTSRRTKSGLVELLDTPVSNKRVKVYKLPVMGYDMPYGMIYKNPNGESMIVDFSSEQDFLDHYFTSSASGIKLKSNPSNPEEDYTSRITTIAIPDSVTKLASDAFSNCVNLKSIILGNEVTDIGASAFYNCTSLESIVLPPTLQTLGNGVFSRCISLKSAEIPASVENWGTRVFEECYSLESATIPAGAITTLNNYSFRNCRKLKSVSIGEGVTAINNTAFEACYNLQEVTLPSTLTTIGNYAFKYCYSLKRIHIPEHVTSIGEEAFAYCYGLTDINIPEGMTEIKKKTFYYCRKLPSVELPSTLTKIGDNAFDTCISLTSITIPASMTSGKIGNSAFGNCHRLFEIFNYTSTHIDPISTSMGYVAKNANVVHNITVDGENVSDEISYKVYNKDSTKVLGTRNSISSLLTVEDGICYCIINDETHSVNRKIAVGLTDPDARELVLANDCDQIKKYAFADCTNIVKIVIPNSVKYIDEANPGSSGGIFKSVGRVYAFYDLTTSRKVRDLQTNSDKSITALSGLTVNSADKFYTAEAVSHVTLEDHVYYYTSGSNIIALNSESTDYSEITIANGCTEIRDKAFIENVYLTDVTIASTVTKIGKNSFEKCYSIANVTMTDGLETIDNYAFNYCSALMQISIPDSVTTLGVSAFSNCTNRETVYLGDNVTSLNEKLFNLSNIEKIFIDKNLTEIASDAFEGASVGFVYFKGSQAEWESILNHEVLENIDGIYIYYYSETYAPGCWCYINEVPSLWI